MATSSSTSLLWRANPIGVIVIIVVTFLVTATVVLLVVFLANTGFVFIGLGMIVGFLLLVLSLRCYKRCSEDKRLRKEFLTLTMESFLKALERESPTKFTSNHLMRATKTYSNMLGSGGFGSVYEGTFSDGTVVAVKVLHGGVSDKRMEEQFMAEVGTIGRVHHLNLVRLIGFCIEKNMAALVYEYMSNGSLDKYLFSENNKSLGFEKLHEIAIGTAKGIAYLHEECKERIIHYDIKPENILLDDNLHPKVADFGLAKLCNREKSYVTMTSQRGTLGYAAPELWMPFRVTHKCDIYSFGIMLFEIIGRRRHSDVNLIEGQEWFPRWVWIKYESKNLQDLIIECAVEDKDKEMVERMVRIALWCVQYKPELRPKMSDVVKMLEGSMDVLEPSNPFQQFLEYNHRIKSAQVDSTIVDYGSYTLEGTDSTIVPAPPMLEIQIDPSKK